MDLFYFYLFFLARIRFTGNHIIPTAGSDIILFIVVLEIMYIVFIHTVYAPL